MASREEARAAVAAVLSEGDPVCLADLPEGQADYLRQVGAAHGVTSDGDIEAALAANRPTAEPELDAIAAATRGGRRGGVR